MVSYKNSFLGLPIATIKLIGRAAKALGRPFFGAARTGVDTADQDEAQARTGESSAVLINPIEHEVALPKHPDGDPGSSDGRLDTCNDAFRK